MNDNLLTWFLVILLIAIIAAHCAKENKMAHHTCKWRLCPYKTAQQYQFKSGCGAENCTPGSNCWLLDSFHTAYPKAEYEQLEDLLRKFQKDNQLPWRSHTF